MSESAVRAFLCMPLPTHIHRSLAELQDMYRERGIRANWVPPDNFHITLHFLGNVSHTLLGHLDRELEHALSGQPAVQIRLFGTGVFPDLRRPKVVWAGVTELQGRGSALHAAGGEAVRASGLAVEERPFHAHVTLFRLRHSRTTGRMLESVQAATAHWASDDFWVDNVALWKSELRRGGAVYHPIKEYPLQCLPKPSSRP